MKTLKEKIIDILKKQDVTTIIEINKDFCEEYNLPNNIIYETNGLNAFLSNQKPLQTIKMALNGDFEANQLYFKLDNNGNLKGFDDLQSEIDFDAIADYSIKNKESFGINEIEELLG